MAATWVSSLIFLATIAVLLTDWVHRTIVVWVGAAVMLAVGLAMGFYTQGQALAAIDFNTLGLLPPPRKQEAARCDCWPSWED